MMKEDEKREARAKQLAKALVEELQEACEGIAIRNAQAFGLPRSVIDRVMTSTLLSMVVGAYFVHDGCTLATLTSHVEVAWSSIANSALATIAEHLETADEVDDDEGVVH